MIIGITVENFKGIREPVRLVLQPITLLFGANSAGKSTILHALHYAREIFERHNLDADRTIAGGKLVDLGGFHQLLHRTDDNKQSNLDSMIKLRIEVLVNKGELSFDDTGIDELIKGTVAGVDRFRDEFQSGFDDIRELCNYQFHTLLKEIQFVDVELEIGWSHVAMCPYVASNTIYFDDEPFVRLEANPQLRGVVAKFMAPRSAIENQHNQTELSTLKHKLLMRPHDVADKRGQLGLPLDDRTLLEILFENCGQQLSFQPNQVDLDELSDALPPLDKSLSFSPSAISPNGDPDHDTRHAFEINLSGRLVDVLSQYILRSCKLVRDNLKQFRYLGPLRDTPPRSFSPPRFYDPSRWASGMGAWDALQTGSDQLVDSVNAWLSDEDKLKAGCGVERRSSLMLDYADPLVRKIISGQAFNELDEPDSLDLKKHQTIKRVAIVANPSGIELHPHDVGVGISQVVPVVVAALDGKDKLVAIEQPELHIHPRIQAALGDLFIEAIMGNVGTQLFFGWVVASWI